MISQTAEYAIRALSYIVANGNGRRILSREISNELKVPANYLSKILHNLVRAGLRRSACPVAVSSAVKRLTTTQLLLLALAPAVSPTSKSMMPRQVVTDCSHQY